jgi:hypothetical protein
MTSSFYSNMSAAAEPLASRREIVAAAVTAAAAAAGTTGSAQAQTPPMLRFSNPPGMSIPPTYSHVVEVNGRTAPSISPARPASMRLAKSPRASAPRLCR